MKDYLPTNSAELVAYVENLYEKVSVAPGNYGLTAADMIALETMKNTFKIVLDDHDVKRIAAGVARILKDDTKVELEVMVRAFVKTIQANPTTTNKMRGDVQITIPDKTGTPTPAPNAMPVVAIDTLVPLRHHIVFSSETSRAKPKGVRALEIWLKLGGDATGNEADYQFQAQDTDSPYIKQFVTSDSGKQAHYLFCWVNAKGERGPWKMASGTVTSELQSGV